MKNVIANEKKVCYNSRVTDRNAAGTIGIPISTKISTGGKTVYVSRNGFIANDEGGDDVFVHFSAIIAEGYRRLKEGQKVTFETEPDPKNPEKLRAVNVQAI